MTQAALQKSGWVDGSTSSTFRPEQINFSEDSFLGCRSILLACHLLNKLNKAIFLKERSLFCGICSVCVCVGVWAAFEKSPQSNAHPSKSFSVLTSWWWNNHPVTVSSNTVFKRILKILYIHQALTETLVFLLY